MILDGGHCPGGLESTVLDVTSEPPRLLRPGLVTPEQIESLIGPIHRFARDPTRPLASPGLLDRHYARRKLGWKSPTMMAARVIELARRDESIGWLTWPDVPPVPNVTRIELPREPIGYAAGLYAALHDCSMRTACSGSLSPVLRTATIGSPSAIDFIEPQAIRGNSGFTLPSSSSANTRKSSVGAVSVAVSA